MPVLGARQQAVVAELIEWWEDQWQRDIGPRVVLVRVPSRWGRSTVLSRFAETVSSAGDQVTLVLRINGRELPEEPGLQAQKLRELLSDPDSHSRIAELLGVDTVAGAAQSVIGAAGLFASGFTSAAAVLLAGVVVGAAGKLWEGSPVRPAGAAARAARSLADVSRSVPVVMLIDDAEFVDPGLAVMLLEGLAFRADGKMLAVVAVDPASGLAATLTKGDRLALAGMVHPADADPDMGYQSRAGLARELGPGLPDAAARRIGQRTQTFAEVFTVTSAEILTEIRPDDDQASVLAALDAVVDAGLRREPPSPEAVMVAWADGPVHARQAAAALAIRDVAAPGRDADLVRSGSLVRLADRSSPRLKAAARALAPSTQRIMAKAVLDEALVICADPLASLVDRIVAGQAAHRIRPYLNEHDRGRLVQVQREVVAGLEKTGDLAAAAVVASEALAECPASKHEHVRQELTAAKLRLARASSHPQDPLVDELIAEAIAGGAALGLEAKIWAAINLLDTPGQRPAALRLTNQITEDLENYPDLGSPAVNWRLLLAFHVGRANFPSITQRLLSPLLTCDDTSTEEAARAVLRAGGGPQADTRLQIAVLEADLRADPPDDDRLRLHNAIASAYGLLGDYRRALSHTQQELRLRQGLQGDDHPATLNTRSDQARWTGKAGDPAGARDQLMSLLSDYVRVLGPAHLATLTARHDHAWWTGRAGDAARARDLYIDLLRDFHRVAGPQHPDALTTRQNLATFTWEAGDPARARDLLAALLPDYERVFGPDHPQSLIARLNHACCTGEAGNAELARDLLAELLLDFERVFGPEHPDTLITRLQHAFFTGEAGDVAAARGLTEALLPDFERILGPHHPDTFNARFNLAYFTWRQQPNSGAH